MAPHDNTVGSNFTPLTIPTTTMDLNKFDFEDFAGFESGASSSSYASPAVTSAFDTGFVGAATVSPQDLLFSNDTFSSSAPNSAAMTNLTSPSLFEGSPSFDSGVSPSLGDFEAPSVDGQWPSLFPLESTTTTDLVTSLTSGVSLDLQSAALGVVTTLPTPSPVLASPVPQEPLVAPSPSMQQPLVLSRPPPQQQVVSTTSSISSLSSPPADIVVQGSDRKSSTTTGRHSSTSGVGSRRRDKPLPPIIVDDPNDVIAMKRARNTLAARKSRERKAQRFDELEARIAELEAECAHWKRMALGQPLE